MRIWILCFVHKTMMAASLDLQTAPRLNEDIYEEMEQIGLFKYKGRAHWGKNRDVAFKGTAAKYPDLPKFLAVKAELDPKGLFSRCVCIATQFCM